MTKSLVHKSEIKDVTLKKQFEDVEEKVEEHTKQFEDFKSIAGIHELSNQSRNNSFKQSPKQCMEKINLVS